MSDPLERLLVRSEDLNRELLAGVLHQRVRIQADTGEIVPGPGWAKLGARQRILLYLLGRKAASALGVLSDGEAAGPKVVQAATGIKAGTLRRVLRELLDEGLVAQQAKRGGYYVPAYAVEEVRGAVSGEKRNG